MPGVLTPLFSQNPLIKPDGTPTDFFIRWAQQKQIDIQGSISAEQAQELIDDWAAARDIIAGTGLAGGGNLSTDRTLRLADTAVAPGIYGNATNVGQFTVDAQGRIALAANVPITGGGGGSHPWWWAPPTAAVLTSLYSGGAGGNITVTDDTDVGTVCSCPMSGGQQIKLATQVLPAGDFTLTARCTRNFAINWNYGGFGVALYETATTKWLSLMRREGTNLNYRGGTSLTSTSVDVNTYDVIYIPTLFFRITRVGTLLKFWYSYDGKNFILTGSTSTFFTTNADRIGLMFYGESGASGFSPLIGSCDQWHF